MSSQKDIDSAATRKKLAELQRKLAELSIEFAEVLQAATEADNSPKKGDRVRFFVGPTPHEGTIHKTTKSRVHIRPDENLIFSTYYQRAPGNVTVIDKEE